MNHNKNGDNMQEKEYLDIVKRLTPKEDKLKNYLYAFFSGALIGFFSELLKIFLINQCNLTVKDASSWVLLVLILLATFFTGLGFFDKYVAKYKAGLIIPITGFAHSIMSCALDYKKDGMITGLGANFFKLAGSVILFGIVSAFIMVIIKVVFNV